MIGGVGGEGEGEGEEHDRILLIRLARAPAGLAEVGAVARAP